MNYVGILYVLIASPMALNSFALSKIYHFLQSKGDELAQNTQTM